MKARIFGAVCFIALCFTLQTTHASSLVYGATLTPVPSGSSPAPGAIVLFAGSSTFTAPDYSGTLFSTVLNNDSSNPYGLGDLTFTYLIQMNASTSDPVSRFTISSFASYMTDASETTAHLGDIIPSSVNRSTAPGGVIRFSFDGALLGAGTTSALLVIQTDAQNWANTQAGLVDGVGSSANSVAPAPIVSTPEPSPAILAGLGLLGLLIARRCNKSQSQTEALIKK
jgi:hypothetical protein